MHASSKSTRSIPSIPMGCPRNDVGTAKIGDLMQIAIIDKHSQYQTSTDEQETRICLRHARVSLHIADDRVLASVQ